MRHVLVHGYFQISKENIYIHFKISCVNNGNLGVESVNNGRHENLTGGRTRFFETTVGK